MSVVHLHELDLLCCWCITIYYYLFLLLLPSTWLLTQDHNCMKELRHLVNRQQQKMSEMQSEIVEAKLQLTEQKQDLLMLKVAIRLF